MNFLQNKHVLLGVTGGIAVYKCPDLVRRLREQGAVVKVVMTDAAQAFVTPLTFQAVSGQRVHTHLLDSEAESAMGHIELARWADVILIAPATADFLARLTVGMANDLLTTLCLASTAPIIVAPTMNQQMWNASITQENCQRLIQRGITLLKPAEGAQACGEVGMGRMPEPLAIVAQLQTFLSPHRLKGYKVLITAGATREDIDPVRFISNRSSGKMGYALANAVLAEGGEVILISGNSVLPPPIGAQLMPVYSAQDMYEAVMFNIENVDIFISTAAVADYRPAQVATQKMKKTVQSELSLPLERTTDILGEIAKLPQRPFTVGFAAETHDVANYAWEKLHRKKLNMIAANPVGKNQGFDSDENTLLVLWDGGEQDLGYGLKQDLAIDLLELVIKRFLLEKNPDKA
ncbi:bifunctional phosphopantothenoylcysteine decarboxylase/phosphopantothenate--cysteine ligase CoaBC [Beggiatoa leptomitoformis]|uniref:Coenzyme A biosynthesis bifunctional protein CoaBC n=1 Tax=Beggiatoa leptomitoformis TaxID=288004 RepID=A0A2N9YA30_9GAMM|nr:bifunctional phosphopantothenoylcysteine decarboxylase/phosphopantothenate--cysteine ligase CoaBC [Beggiatoa leptomitoformis]ALG67266.1 bifunctional phosphopantothenoylcysteine decarboxylase/phosphopantothenate--cysteine ligase CoaBC [Beggiatoa leptomitoformis]AUI67309.1 bifunctional phosphopantothenoylcysteine decarboxylase/phosphopantothenate--cysteine ligase CoaBC [Beggiatoa leptomitoformis]